MGTMKTSELRLEGGGDLTVLILRPGLRLDGHDPVTGVAWLPRLRLTRTRPLSRPRSQPSTKWPSTTDALQPSRDNAVALPPNMD